MKLPLYGIFKPEIIQPYHVFTYKEIYNRTIAFNV